MINVSIFGWCWAEDFKYFDDYTKQNLNIKCKKGIVCFTDECEYSRKNNVELINKNSVEWRDAWENCKNDDLIIIPSFGLLSEFWEENLHCFQKVFKYPKNIAYWTFDNHIDEKLKEISKNFSHNFHCHKKYAYNCLDNSNYLPLCFWLYDYDKAKQILSKNVEKENDFVFHHNRYNVGKRNGLIKDIENILINQGVKHDFSHKKKDEYFQSIIKSKVGLNVPLMQDLNFRNFEVWMTNTPLLTNYLPDYEDFPELKNETIFFNDDLSDFEDKIKLALNREKAYTQSHIIEKNMLTHRYLTIINTILNTNFKVNFPQ